MIRPSIAEYVVALAIGVSLCASARAQQLTSKSLRSEGQLVCSIFWFEADRHTTAYGTGEDLKSAAECADKNIPPALAVKTSDDYSLYPLEDGKLKRLPTEWRDLAGTQVRLQVTL